MKFYDDIYIGGNLRINQVNNAVSSQLTALFYNDNGEITKRVVGDIINSSTQDFIKEITFSFPNIFSLNRSVINGTNNSLTATLVTQTKGTVFAANGAFNSQPSFIKLTSEHLSDANVMFNTHVANTITDSDIARWNNAANPSEHFLPLTGGTLTGNLTLNASTVDYASLNIPSGVAPNTPQPGDIWYTASGLTIRIGSTTRVLAHTSQWSEITEAAILSGTESTARFISARRLQYAFDNIPAANAIKLYTPRKINGVSFDGTTDITIAAAPTAHTHAISDITALQTTLDGKQAKHVNLDKVSGISTNSVGYIKKDASNNWSVVNDLYSAGNGLTLTGTVFSLLVTSDGSGEIVSAVAQTTSGISVSKVSLTSLLTGAISSVLTTNLSTSVFVSTDSNGKLASTTIPLSSITTNKISNWDNAATNNHTHSNKDKLDLINQTLSTTASPTFNRINLTSTAGSWISGHLSSPINFTAASSATSYSPWMNQSFSDGSNVSVGTLGTNLYFSFTTSDNMSTSTNNTTKIVSINTSGITIIGKIIRSGGTSAQFLKADGSLDENAYITENTARASLVTSTSATGTTNVVTTNTNTYLNVTQNGASPGSSTQVTGAGSVTVSSDTAGKLTITGTDTTYSAGNGLTLSGTTFSLPVTDSGSGNYVSNVVASTNGLTVTKATLPTPALVTSTSATGATNVVTTNTNTYLNVTQNGASPGSSTQVTGAGSVTVSSDANGKLTITGTNTTYSEGSLALLTAGTDTTSRVWKVSDLVNYFNSRIATQYFSKKYSTFNSYICYVVPLFEYTTDTNQGNNYFYGEVIFNRSNGNSLYRDIVKVYGGSAHNSQPSVVFESSNSSLTLVSFTYNTKKYIGVRSTVAATHGDVFINAISSNFTLHTPVSYYNSDTLAVINAEINSSIQNFVVVQKTIKKNYDIETIGTVKSDSFIKINGTSEQFLKADGSVDTTAYTTDTKARAALVTSTSATGATNVATTNTNTYLNVTQNGASPGSSTQVTGAGSVTVSSDANGKLTITGTDTNTTYSAGNGLTLSGTAFSLPVTDSGSGNYVSNVVASTNGLTVTKATLPTPALVTSTSATGATNVATTNTNTYLNVTQNGASPGSSTQVTGAGSVTVSSDANGKLTITGTDTNTTYTAGNGLTLSGTAFSLPVTQSGSGNAVTAVTQGTNGITVTKTDTFLKKIEPSVGLLAVAYSNTSLASTQKSKLRITLPFKTNAGVMLSFTIRLYGGYRAIDILCSGYLYSSPNNWYSPSATIVAENGVTTSLYNNIQVVFGRDEDGYAYVTIPNFDYIGVAVLNAVRGYSNTGTASPILPTIDWTITQNEDTPNISSTLNIGIRESIPVATTTLKGLIKVGTNLSITADGTLSSTYTNTTYTAGNGLTLSGTAFSLPVTDSGSGNYVSNVVASTNGLTVTKATLPTPALVTSTSATGATNVVTTNTNTYLNVTQNGASPGSSTQVTGAGSVTVSSDANGKLTITGTNTTYSAGTTDILITGTDTTARLWSPSVLDAYMDDTLAISRVKTKYAATANLTTKALIRLNITTIGYYFVGHLKVSFTSSYSSANANGVVVIEGGIGSNSSSIWNNQLTCTLAQGNFINNFYVDPVMKWDATNKQLYLEIHKKASSGNALHVKVEYFGTSQPNLTPSVVISATDTSIVLTNQQTITSDLSVDNAIQFVSNDGTVKDYLRNTRIRLAAGGTVISSNNTSIYFRATDTSTTQASIDSAANMTATSFIKSGGTSAQFLKADGSVDATAYTTDAKARAALVTSTSATGVSNVATTNTNTYLNITQNGASPGSSTQVTGAGSVTVSSDTAGKLTITGTDTNTTYSAGNGLTLSGTTFSLPVTDSGSGNYVSNVVASTNGLTVTKATLPTPALVTSTSATGATNVATTNTNTYLNVTQNGASPGSSTQVTGAGSVTVSSDANGKLTITGTDTNTTYSAGTAALLTAGTDTTQRTWQSKILRDEFNNYLTNKNGITTNLTTSYAPGVGYWGNTTTGRPSEYGTYLNLVSTGVNHDNSGNWLVQLGFSTDANKIFYRNKTNSSAFNSWVELYHSGNIPVNALVTSTSATGVSNVATTNTNTYLNIVRGGTSTGSSTQVTGAGSVTVTSDTAGKLTITGTDTNTTYTAGNGLTLSGTAFSLPVTDSGSGNTVSNVVASSTGLTITKTNAPLSAVTSTYVSNTVRILDNRDVELVPNTNLARGIQFDFKSTTGLSLTGAGTYASVITMVPYGDNTGNTNTAFQLAQSSNNLYFRNWGTSWGSWDRLVKASEMSGYTTTTQARASLVTSTSATGTTNVATTNTNTYLNVTQNGASPGSSTQVTGAGSVTVSSDTAGKLTITGTDTNTTYSAGTTALLDTGTDTANRVWPTNVLKTYFNKYSLTSHNHDSTYLKLSGGELTGTLTAPSFYEKSLRRLKRNIKPFEKSGLDLIKSIEIVTFDRIDMDIKNKIGVIADDTPSEFLSESKNAVDLYKTVFIQARAIQELESKNQELELSVKKLGELIHKMLGV